MGARSGTARRELPGHARRRAPAVQPAHVGTALGRRAKISACRSSPTSAAARTRATRDWSRCALLQLESAMFSRRGGLVADLRRRVRTPSRAEARDHRDARELVPADRDRARHAPRVLRLEARRAVEQGAARAGAAATERVHGEQRVLRRQLRLALRGGAGGAARPRLAVALGIRLPAPRRHVRVRTRAATRRRSPGSPCATRSATSPRPRPSGWSAGTRSTSTTSTPQRCATIAREIDAPTLDELATPIDAVPAAGSVTAFRSGAGGWS